MKAAPLYPYMLKNPLNLQLLGLTSRPEWTPLHPKIKIFETEIAECLPKSERNFQYPLNLIYQQAVYPAIFYPGALCLFQVPERNFLKYGTLLFQETSSQNLRQVYLP